MDKFMQLMVNGPKDCAWNKAGLSLVSTVEEVPLSSAGNGLWLGKGSELPASHRQVLTSKDFDLVSLTMHPRG